MAFLNYHHLRYFREIAAQTSIARAAQKLNISSPALSVQLKQLEDSLGHKLFERERRGLRLTETGRVALEYAEIIYSAGEELVDALEHRPHAGLQVLRVGAVSTLSRNFQLQFLQPALRSAQVEVVIRSGSLRELLVQLESHQIDVMLSNQSARQDTGTPWHSHLLDEQPVVLVGTPEWKAKKLRFPQQFQDVPIILPSLESNTRADFDRLMHSAKIRPSIVAEVDDMAMLRLLALEGGALTLVPRVVVRDEIAGGELVVTHRIPQLRETFFAITPTRRYPNHWVAKLVAAMTK
ncbi:MAG: LysR family transcriptional regulator [Chthoniobacterales bacterium]